MLICGVDPGDTQSAVVVIDQEYSIIRHSIMQNAEALDYIANLHEQVVIERIASYGMSVGQTIFDTCVWIGRFFQADFQGGGSPVLIFRKDVKMHLCGQTRAKDGNVRQALIDQFGAPGKKASPGRLYGIKADEWQALALAVTYLDGLKQGG